MRALAHRYGWRLGLALWLAWSAVDFILLWPAFRAVLGLL